MYLCTSWTEAFTSSQILVVWPVTPFVRNHHIKTLNYWKIKIEFLRYDQQKLVSSLSSTLVIEILFYLFYLLAQTFAITVVIFTSTVVCSSSSFFLQVLFQCLTNPYFWTQSILYRLLTWQRRIIFSLNIAAIVIV